MDGLGKTFQELVPIVGPVGAVLSIMIFVMWKGWLRWDREYVDLHARYIEMRKERDEWMSRALQFAHLGEKAASAVEMMAKAATTKEGQT